MSSTSSTSVTVLQLSNGTTVLGEQSRRTETSITLDHPVIVQRIERPDGTGSSLSFTPLRGFSEKVFFNQQHIVMSGDADTLLADQYARYLTARKEHSS